MGGLKKISSRLGFTIIIQLLILATIGLVDYIAINRISSNSEQAYDALMEAAIVGEMDALLQNKLIHTLDHITHGTLTWDEASATLSTARSQFDDILKRYVDSIKSDESKQDVLKQFEATSADTDELFREIERLFSNRDSGQLDLFVRNDLEDLISPVGKIMANALENSNSRAVQSIEQERKISTIFTWVIVALLLIGIVVSFGLGTSTYRAITNPLNQIMGTVQSLGQGNYESRTNLKGVDELSELGQAFDNMLDDRVNALVQAEHENEQLNNSIISLLQAVAQLSQRDLTIRVPVTEDITGPIADSLNLLTSETARVLQGVTNISEQVATASDNVKMQSDNIMSVADDERRVVQQTSDDLSNASVAMQQIASLAQECNIAAEKAIATTQAALQTVTSTVEGINNTRDTIRETEKRIKRLGERSQEISGVVNLINTIAERTHILALNASMHAASAGEAGRGFAVVADEVQRLAENAREATSQIATLVSNIQIETQDTVNAMNAAITQVVDGSRLAEQSGEQMQDTQETTAELVTAVQQIATRSQQQAEISKHLLERANQIQESTRQTNDQLQAQTVQTDNLVEYAKNLLDSVRVFRLPAAS